MPQKSDKEPAQWTVDDVTAMLEFLNEWKHSAGNGLNFKKPDWNAAAVRVNENLIEGGPNMGVMQVKVLNSESRLFIYHTLQCQISTHIAHGSYELPTMSSRHTNSGWKWDDEKGVDIDPATKGA